MERIALFWQPRLTWLAFAALCLPHLSVAESAVLRAGLPAAATQAPRANGALQEQEKQQSDAKQQDIQKLLGLLDVWGTTAALGPVIADEFAASLSEESPDLANSVADSFRQALLDVLGRDLGDSQSMLRQSYADLYDRNFNATEIAELVAFYQTDTGQKYVRQQKVLVNDSAMVLQAWLNGARDRVIVRFEELMAISSAAAETLPN